MNLKSMTSGGSGSDLELISDDDADYGVVQNQVGAYQGEPLGNYEDEEDTGPANNTVNDSDWLSLATLESRFEKRVPVSQW